MNMLVWTGDGCILSLEPYTEIKMVSYEHDTVISAFINTEKSIPRTLCRFHHKEIAQMWLDNLYAALENGQTAYRMPTNLYDTEQDVIKDARVVRKGRS